MIFGRTVATVGTGAAVLFSGATASASPSDDAFLATLDKQGITYASPERAITTAKEICTLLDDGANGVDVSREISKNSVVQIEKSGYFVGASITAYCPSHTDAFAPTPG
jgi:hypothetical protein